MLKLKKLMSIPSAVALCISLASCSNETTPEETSASEPAQTFAQQQTAETRCITTTVQSVYVQPETREETIYNHVALQGAVVIQQDGSQSFKYQKKCEACGHIDNTRVGANATSGTLNSIFNCPECDNCQKIQIETTKQ